MYQMLTCNYFADNRPRLVYAIHMQHSPCIQDQDTAATQIKEVCQWLLLGGRTLTLLIMKMPTHFQNNGGKQCTNAATHFKQMALSISMRPLRRRRDQCYIILWTLRWWRCKERNVIGTVKWWMTVQRWHRIGEPHLGQTRISMIQGMYQPYV